MWKSILICLLWSASVAAQNPDGATRMQAHRRIAVLPPQVHYYLASRDTARIEQMHQQLIRDFQQEIHGWFVTRQLQGRMQVVSMDPDSVNRLLRTAGYPDSSLSATRCCALLGVDAVINSVFQIRILIPEGVNVAVNMLGKDTYGFNTIQAYLTVEDGAAGILWEYPYSAVLGVDDSPKTSVERMMRRLSKKIPYYRKH